MFGAGDRVRSRPRLPGRLKAILLPGLNGLKGDQRPPMR